MKPLRDKFICFLLFGVGILLIGGGVYGFMSLTQASKTFVHTTGVVKSLRSEREYRHRKMRIRHHMQISYETEQYGQMYASTESYWPFRREGDSLEVLYHPDRPHDIRLPSNERCIWVTLLAVGLLCMVGFWLLLKSRRRLE